MKLKYQRDAFLVFILLAFTYMYFFQDPANNGNSRLALVLSIVQQGRLTIDSFQAIKDLDTGDKSFYNGHYYSDKAIGTSVVGTLFYLPWYWSLKLFRLDFINHNLGLVKHYLTLCVIGLPSAFAGSLMYVICKYLSGNRFRAFIATVAIALGTMCLPYSILFYGHQLAATFLFCGFFLIFQFRILPERRGFINLFLIGLSLGFALITEYTTAVIILPLLIYFVIVAHKEGLFPSAKSIAFPALGGLIPGALLMTYNTLCFGNPFSIGYSFEAKPIFNTAMAQGFMGITVPKLDVLYYITLHPADGIFWQSPVLLMALVGIYFMLRDKQYRMEAVITLLALISYLLLNSGYYMWWGGYAIGPRLLIPMLPFLSLPLVFVPRRIFFLVFILCIVSIFQMIIVVASVVQVPEDTVMNIKNLSYFQYMPVYSYCMKQLLAGKYGWNLGQRLFGLKTWKSLLPPVLVIIGGSLMFIPKLARASAAAASRHQAGG
jgi:hypothetical protein